MNQISPAAKELARKLSLNEDRAVELIQSAFDEQLQKERELSKNQWALLVRSMKLIENIGGFIGVGNYLTADLLHKDILAAYSAAHPEEGKA